MSELVPFLQTAISPAILISATGLLLLAMTNRLSHIVDRARYLSAEIEKAEKENKEKITEQIQILWKRTKIIRKAIILASFSALLSSILIITLFVSKLLHIELSLLIALLFVLSMSCLMASLITFIRDINKALAALKLEIEGKDIDM